MATTEQKIESEQPHGASANIPLALAGLLVTGANVAILEMSFEGTTLESIETGIAGTVGTALGIFITYAAWHYPPPQQ